MSQHTTANGSGPPADDESSPPDLKDERFAPFARFDAYGDMGVAPQPPGERIYRALATILLLPPRVIIAIFCLVATWALCKLDALVPASMRPQFVAFWGKMWVRGCLFGLGFVRVRWVKVKGPQQQDVGAPPAKACAIVSNHCSWLDIMVHMSHFFPSFVAREGTQNIPLVGLVSQKIQCFFVNREAGGQGTSALVKERIINKAKHIDSTAEYPMLLFPEGTTTNGRYLLPFKKGAFLAGVPVQPVVLKYHMWKVNMCWDTIPITRHIFLMLTEPWNCVTCYELPVYVPSEAEKADPELYASNVREAMLKFGGFKPSDSNLDTKKIYHRAIGYTKPPKPKPGNKAAPGNGTPTVHAKVA